MLVRLLIYIKHHFAFLWRFVEGLNSLLYRLMHSKKQQKVVPEVMGEFKLPGYTFRLLQQTDMAALAALIAKQAPGRLAWFKPHGFDEASLQKAWRNPAFQMMGAFDGPLLVQAAVATASEARAERNAFEVQLAAEAQPKSRELL